MKQYMTYVALLLTACAPLVSAAPRPKLSGSIGRELSARGGGGSAINRQAIMDRSSRPSVNMQRGNIKQPQSMPQASRASKPAPAKQSMQRPPRFSQDSRTARFKQVRQGSAGQPPKQAAAKRIESAPSPERPKNINQKMSSPAAQRAKAPERPTRAAQQKQLQPDAIENQFKPEPQRMRNKPSQLEQSDHAAQRQLTKPNNTKAATQKQLRPEQEIDTQTRNQLQRTAQRQDVKPQNIKPESATDITEKQPVTQLDKSQLKPEKARKQELLDRSAQREQVIPDTSKDLLDKQPQANLKDKAKQEKADRPQSEKSDGQEKPDRQQDSDTTKAEQTSSEQEEQKKQKDQDRKARKDRGSKDKPHHMKDKHKHRNAKSEWWRHRGGRHGGHGRHHRYRRGYAPWSFLTPGFGLYFGLGRPYYNNYHQLYDPYYGFSIYPWYTRYHNYYYSPYYYRTYYVDNTSTPGIAALLGIGIALGS